MDESGMQNQIIESEKIYKIKGGFCLIINIINFDEREDLKRNGSEDNVKLIKKAFHRFEVEDYYDLEDDQVIRLIDEKVDNEKSKSYDTFIYTHEIQDTILCKNSYEKDEKDEKDDEKDEKDEKVLIKIVYFHEIVKLFKDENCEYLKDKPKLIIFDCCRKG